MKNLIKKIFPKRFHKFYEKIRDNEKLDKELIEISDSFIKSESYKTVSNMWHLLNIQDYKNISNSGLNMLGKDTFGHYANFYDYREEHLNNLFKNINQNNLINLNSDIFKKHNNLSLKQSCEYNYLLLLLYYNLKQSVYFKYLNDLSDQTYLNFGDNFINIENNNITSDKIISLFDLESIEKFTNIDNNKILEIGAGSGRTAECILSTKNISSYAICDIPPALYISYKRLKMAFPNKNIELLINVNDKHKLNEKILNNHITFIFPHQIKNIEKNFFDLTIGIDCFHEMNKSTLDFYFNNISDISKKFYFSIWKKTKNWDSGGLFKKTERLDFEKGDYPIPSTWKIIYKEELKFPGNHIGIGYLI
tara:strand:+ start:5635 stop:6726 length:1092 start_codon:yes stop_codon:yes gene_type:complete